MNLRDDAVVVKAERPAFVGLALAAQTKTEPANEGIAPASIATTFSANEGGDLAQSRAGPGIPSGAPVCNGEGSFFLSLPSEPLDEEELHPEFRDLRSPSIENNDIGSSDPNLDALLDQLRQMLQRPRRVTRPRWRDRPDGHRLIYLGLAALRRNVPMAFVSINDREGEDHRDPIKYIDKLIRANGGTPEHFGVWSPIAHRSGKRKRHGHHVYIDLAKGTPAYEAVARYCRSRGNDGHIKPVHDLLPLVRHYLPRHCRYEDSSLRKSSELYKEAEAIARQVPDVGDAWALLCEDWEARQAAIQPSDIAGTVKIGSPSLSPGAISIAPSAIGSTTAMGSPSLAIEVPLADSPAAADERQPEALPVRLPEPVANPESSQAPGEVLRQPLLYQIIDRDMPILVRIVHRLRDEQGMQIEAAVSRVIADWQQVRAGELHQIACAGSTA